MTPPYHWRSRDTWVILALLGFHVLLSVQRGAHKLLWFDELSTLNVVTQPTLARMFHAAPPDANPPLEYLLCRVCVHAFGVNAFALRLPLLCGTALAIICVYVFVARRFGRLAATMGAALLMLSPACDYGVEARPYGLLLGLTALTLVLWQAAMSSERRSGTLACLAVTVFTLTITHPFGIVWAAAPVFAGECIRWWRARRLDVAVLTVMLVGFTGFAITLYFGAKTRAILLGLTGGAVPAVSLPTLARLCGAFRWNGSFRALELLLPIGTAVWWIRRRNHAQGDRETVGPGAPLHEWIVVAALIFCAFLVYLITFAATHYFWPRYVMASELGCVLLLTFTCGALHKRSILLGVFVLGVLLMIKDGEPLFGLNRIAPLHDLADGTLLANADTSEPVVVENPIQYPQMWWYSPPHLRARLHYVADVQQAMPTGNFMSDAELIAMHDTGSTLFPTDTLPGFLAANKRFLLWQGAVRNGNWLSGYLRANHYEFVAVASDDSGDTLWEVSAPASGR